MKATQLHWTENSGWKNFGPDLSSPQLVVATAGIDVISKPFAYDDLKSKFPNSQIVLLSTAGEIRGDMVYDNSIVANVLQFDHTSIQCNSFQLQEYANSYECGKAIQEKCARPDLAHILLLSDGNLANGDQLIRGVNENLPLSVLVTGGLAGDAGRFSGTLVGCNGAPEIGKVVAICFYGDRLHVRSSSKGGWDEFGPVRVITDAENNILRSLDNQPALAIYKNFLGEKAKNLPGSALLFPICIKRDNGELLVRTILNIDHEKETMTFAGDVPVGSKVQFMMANFDRLIDGASDAAKATFESNIKPDWVFMVSCVGRKIVLAQRIDEELEGVVDTLGKDAVYGGFYSNGELAPVNQNGSCSLQNQTMTITTYSEV